MNINHVVRAEVKELVEAWGYSYVLEALAEHARRHDNTFAANILTAAAEKIED